MIDFSRYIARRTRDFTGRRWVFEAVHEWLADEDAPRIFLLTGEPGSGKTALAARLVQISQGDVAPPENLDRLGADFLGAFHFCSARDRHWINPHAFAQAIALQLAERHPPFAEALVEQSGERHIHIEVEQRVGRVEGGQVSGVVVQRLDVGAAPAEEAFRRVVREPLERIYADGYQVPVVLLVDGLDEALAYAMDANILSLLAEARYLPGPVRMLLTSRPETAVLRPLRRMQPRELSLSSGSGHYNSLEDVRAHVLNYLDAHPTLEARFAPALSREAFAAEVQKKSDGNFLYAQTLLEYLQETQAPVDRDSLEVLPAGLTNIYLELIDQLVGERESRWAKMYAPVLGTLAVAHRALTERQVAAFTGKSRSATRRALTRLRRFLDILPERSDQPPVHSLYHQTFADFLLSEGRAEEYWLEPVVQHRRILDYYIAGFADRWADCDDYGLRFVTHHALAGGRHEVLDRIFTSGFLDASVDRFGWYMPVVEHLQLAETVLPPEHTARLCLQIVYGRAPNSLVFQKILKLLAEEVRPKLAAQGLPLGRPSSKLDQAIEEAVVALAAPPGEAVPRLIELIDRVRNQRVRGLIALALGETGSARAAPTLMRILREEKRALSWAAADALIALGDRSIADELMEWFRDPELGAGLKQRVLYVLGRMQATEARALVEPGLAHPNYRVKAQAINMLWLLAPVEGAETLLWEKLGFRDGGVAFDRPPVWKNEWLQKRLVTALGRVGSLEALPHLERLAASVAARPEPETPGRKRQRTELIKAIQRALQDLQRRHRIGP